MAHQQSSELLRVLGQLGDAAWAKKLLPLLRADKSAGAVALACKQLQLLCHGNQRGLKLTGANCQHLEPLELDAFSRHFPTCSSVAFIASSTDDLGLRFTVVLPLLARLPKLQSLQLNINSMRASTPDRMAPALQLLRLQLPQLRSLQLELHSSWNSPRCWMLLGIATQLTKLAIDFKNRAAVNGVRSCDDDDSDDDDDDDDPGLSLEHLSALQPLGSNLQHLELTAEGIDRACPQDCSFIGSFSGLTSLRVPVISARSGLAAISSCTALQHLHLKQRKQAMLDAAECAALPQLTRLTRMDIAPSAHMPALLAALRCLRNLKVLVLRAIDSSHLPVLAALPKLTGLRGSWAESAEQAAAASAGGAPATCPTITKLWMTGPFPPAAFPGARTILMNDAWQPSRLAGLSQHMKKLELLGSGFINTSTFRSLDRSALEAERVAAVRSLGQLPQLTQLQFALNDDAEAAALGTVTQLRQLWMSVPQGSRMFLPGLSSVLCRLAS